jgi:acyl carrier protein
MHRLTTEQSMRNTDSVAKEVRDFIISNFVFGQGTNLEDHTSFLDSGTVDSTGVMELVAFLEQHYQLKIAANRITPENLDSINRVARFITGLLAEKESQSIPEIPDAANPESGPHEIHIGMA